MLLLIVFIGWLVVSPIVHLLLRQDALSSFRWLAPVVRECASDKRLSVIFVGAISLHFIGSRTLGQDGYNSGFDILTHTMFGFLVREYIDRTNRVHPAAGQFVQRLPRPVRRMATVTGYAFLFCLAHEIQESLQAVIPVLRSMVYIPGWSDPVKDMAMNTIGIGISRWTSQQCLMMSDLRS